MAALSRRQFGRIVLASAPLAIAPRVSRAGVAARVVVGVATSSFRELPRVPGQDNVDDIIAALRVVRATDIELALANVEPAPPSVAPVMGGSSAYPRRIVLSPEEVAATNADARAALRAWRLRAPAGVFADIRRRLISAGMTLHACALAFNDSFTDEEIDATFGQAAALGATTVSSPLTMRMAKRLVPFAERHRVTVAIHNQVDGNAVGAIASAQFDEVLAMSPRFMLKLDAGHLTASNDDAVATLRARQARVSYVLLKDRLRNNGDSQPFGEGDTPIAALLHALRSSTRSIPVMVDYDYVGLRPAADEVAASLTYVAKALER
jgi:sugar phosphate isomerase/epimerase